MKALLLISALVSGTSFAQTLDVAGLKNLMTSKKATLERSGFSKIERVLTLFKKITDCNLKNPILHITVNNIRIGTCIFKYIRIRNIIS